MRLKVNALYAEEREKPCPHDHMPYRARFGMPCTGPRVCTMCGITDEELKVEEPEVWQRKFGRFQDS